MTKVSIEVDKALLNKCLKTSGLQSIEQLLDLALHGYLENARVMKKILSLEGKVKWEGDLKAMRRDRTFE